MVPKEEEREREWEWANVREGYTKVSGWLQKCEGGLYVMGNTISFADFVLADDVAQGNLG